jgi:hypothetical protein
MTAPTTTRIARTRRTRSTPHTFATPTVHETERGVSYDPYIDDHNGYDVWQREVYNADPAQVGDARYL